MITEESTLEDVAFAVFGALEAHGIQGVLTGGSAAVLYAPQKYASHDADFVLDGDEPLHAVASALNPLGFRRDGKSRVFSHPKSRFTVDFRKGPLAIAGEYVVKTDVLTRGAERLRILTRYDCVRDRLAHFYYWDDYTALNAAVAVAAALDTAAIATLRERTQRESPQLLEKFREFERRVDSVK